MDYLAGHPLADGAAVGVVDVGATSFEAAVAGRRGGELVLLSHQAEHGTIGGDQFDDAGCSYVDHSIGGAVTEVKEMSGLQAQIALARLRRDCREAKEALSTDKSATLTAYLPSGPQGHPHPRGVRRHHPGPGASGRRRVAGVMGSVAAPLQAIVLTGGCAPIPLLQRLLGRAATGPLEVAPSPQPAARRSWPHRPCRTPGHRNGAMSSTPSRRRRPNLDEGKPRTGSPAVLVRR